MGPLEEQFIRIREVLDKVPLGRANREAQLGTLRDDEGNKALDGYDCVIWTIDAISALAAAKIIDLGCKNAGKGLFVLLSACCIIYPFPAFLAFYLRRVCT